MFWRGPSKSGLCFVLSVVPNQLQHTSAAILGTNSQCIEIGNIRRPHETGAMSPIEMPFGMFD